MKLKSVFIMLIFLYFTSGSRTLPKYQINLDLPPSQRFKQVGQDFKDHIVKLRDYLIDSLGNYQYILELLTHIRKEDPEMMDEIQGISQITGIKVAQLQYVNWMYEYSIVRFFSTYKQNQMRNCMGLIGRDSQNGTIYHARNLDFDFPELLSNLLYDAVFIKNGKELFRSTQFAGYQGVLTAIKIGAFTLNEDTRFAQSNWENLVMMYNLLSGKTLNTWNMRKIVETADNFKEAVEKLENIQMITNQYLIISGLQGNEGVILARSPQKVTHKIELTDDINYILISNYDFWNNDPQEASDPRRQIADSYLKNQTQITPQILFDTISQEGVQVNGTTLQVLMSAHSGYFNTSTQYGDSQQN